MTGTLDDRYLAWLYRQVSGRSVKAHWKLMRQLYSTEFVWYIPNDDNRAEDGRGLRQEFVAEQVISRVDPDWMGLGCSFLEMLIALSRRLSFEAEGEPSVWFWHLIETLNLRACKDASDYNEDYVADKVGTVIWRTYDRNGNGGLFPLRDAQRDQTKVEIWYQLSTWLLQTT